MKGLNSSNARCIFIFWIHNVFLGLRTKQSRFCIARISKAVHNSEFGSFMYLTFSWIKVYFYHITYSYLCIMIFNLTFQALDPNFRNQNFWRDTILNFDTKWKIVTVTCNTYDTNFLLFPRISNFRKLFVQVDFSMYLSRYKVFVF